MFSAIFENETNSESGKILIILAWLLKKKDRRSAFGDYLQQPPSLVSKYSDCSFSGDLTCLLRADGHPQSEEVKVRHHP